MDWTIDPTHTNVDFAVRHMGIATVRGTFEDVAGTVKFSDDAKPELIDVVIKTESVNTRDANRDGHLRSADFFEADAHPEIRFRSQEVTPIAGNRYRIDGELTIRGVTRPVSFEAETAEAITDPWGNQRVAATASGKINRKDWGLTWNQVLEMGALMVSEEVKFTLEVQAVAQSAAATS